ncbi:MAG: hypothetical protein IPL83_03165 [Bdellovibrionales bacterium]|nr:hypothetical protein [Bdellovibrionales bacterium]
MREPASDAVENGRDYGQSDDKDFEDSYDRFLKFIPDENLRRTLSSYLAEVSQIHSGSNESIEVSNQKTLDKNSCLAEIAGEFYLDLMKEDLLRTKSDIDRRGKNSPFGMSLDEEAGKGFWKNQKSGFLWTKLMEITDNNPNLAFAIIKMCGHDNAIYQKPHLSAHHPSFRRLKQRQVRILEFFERSWQDIPEGIKEWLEDEKKSNHVGFGCLANSTLYLPKALGFDLDISPNLKAKIGRLQAPNRGLSSLPAKHYHLLAAAATGCLFKQETGYSFIGSNLTRAGARLYRAKSLGGKWLQTQPPSDLKNWDSLTPQYFSDEKIRSLILLQKETDPSKLRLATEFDTYLKDLLYMQDKDEFEKKSMKYWREYIWAKVSRRDAARLWKKWYRKTTLPGVGEVWLPNRARRPEFDDDRVWNSNPLQHLSSRVTTPECDEKWTKDRCLDAIAVMETWEVDFEWSQEAHWVGARFGEKNCRKLELNESLETFACSALAKRAKEAGGPQVTPSPQKNSSGSDATR